MLATTMTAIQAVLAADPSIDGQNRARILEGIKQSGRTGTDKTVDPIVRRLEAAERLGISPRTLDLWRRQGRVKPVPFGAGTRAVGFRQSVIETFINGGAA